MKQHVEEKKNVEKPAHIVVLIRSKGIAPAGEGYTCLLFLQAVIIPICGIIFFYIIFYVVKEYGH
jgi:hypothetical protein